MSPRREVNGAVRVRARGCVRVVGVYRRMRMFRVRVATRALLPGVGAVVVSAVWAHDVLMLIPVGLASIGAFPWPRFVLHDDNVYPLGKSVKPESEAKVKKVEIVQTA